MTLSQSELQPKFYPVSVDVNLDGGEIISYEDLVNRVEAKELLPGMYMGFAKGAGFVHAGYYSNEIFQELPEILANLVNTDDADDIRRKLMELTTAQKNSLMYALLLMYTSNVQNKFYILKIAPHFLDYSLDIDLTFALSAATNGSNASSIPYLQLLIDCFGAEFLSRKYHGSTILTDLFAGNINIVGIAKPFKFLIKNGVDINSIDDRYGTFLHIVLANELGEELVKKVLVLIENTKPQQIFDYTTLDSEGKTPLLLAVKTRAIGSTAALLALADRDINIGISIPDSEGRTPLLMAFALGCVKLIPLLLKAGASLNEKDNLGRGVEYYKHIPTAEVENTLRSIHIEPQRDFTTHHNWLYDENIMPLAYTHPETGRETLILLSSQQEHKKILEEVLAFYPSNSVTHKHVRHQYLSYLSKSSTTMLDVCLTGQTLCQVFIRKLEEKLRIACALGDINSVRELLGQGVDCNAIDEEQRTSLHYAVMRKDLVRNMYNRQNKHIGTIPEAHILSCMSAHAQIFALLLEYNACPTALNKTGNSPLMLIERDCRSNDPVDKQTSLDIFEISVSLNLIEREILEAVNNEHKGMGASG
jgi:ankyrin repeat protein